MTTLNLTSYPTTIVAAPLGPYGFARLLRHGPGLSAPSTHRQRLARGPVGGWRTYALSANWQEVPYTVEDGYAIVVSPGGKKRCRPFPLVRGCMTLQRIDRSITPSGGAREVVIATCRCGRQARVQAKDWRSGDEYSAAACVGCRVARVEVTL